MVEKTTRETAAETGGSAHQGVVKKGDVRDGTGEAKKSGFGRMSESHAQMEINDDFHALPPLSWH